MPALLNVTYSYPQDLSDETLEKRYRQDLIRILETIREVASEVEQEEPHKKQYWFGVPDAKAKSSQTDAKGLPLTSARVTNTRLNALVQSIHEREEAERSGIDSEAKQD